MAKKKSKKKIKTKKVTRRSKAKNASLDPKYTIKSRLDLLDYDYLDQLNAKDLEWLNRFSSEYLHASFDSENPKKNLHNKEQELEIYRNNYAHQTDVLTHKKTRKMLDYVSDKELERIEIDVEDALISIIDLKKS